MKIYEEQEVRAMFAELLREHGVTSWAKAHGFARGSAIYLSRLARGSGGKTRADRPYRVTDRVLRSLGLRRVYVAIGDETLS
jgi:hypothetical protein